MMITDAATQSKIDACRHAHCACATILARAGREAKLLADKELIGALAEALRVTRLSAACLQRLPDLREMVLRVCVEISARAAMACAKHKDAEVLVCGEALAACAAICAGAPEIEMVPTVRLKAPVACLH